MGKTVLESTLLRFASTGSTFTAFTNKMRLAGERLANLFYSGSNYGVKLR